MRYLSKHRSLIATYVALAVASVGILFPLLWMVSTSLKPNDIIINLPPEWVPSKVTASHYTGLVEKPLLWTGIRNGFIVSTSTALVCVILGSLAGYGVSRYPFRYSGLALVGVLATQMFPGVVLLISFYLFMTQLGLLNSYYALILAFSSFGLPFSIWMMKGFFDTLPKELEDAFQVDGGSRLSFIWRIGIPLVLPGVMATFVYTWLISWDEFLFSLTLTNSQEMRTMPTALIMSFVGEFSYKWGEMMAAAVVVSLPVFLMFVFLQRYVVQGLTHGAVKE